MLWQCEALAAHITHIKNTCNVGGQHNTISTLLPTRQRRLGARLQVTNEYAPYLTLVSGMPMAGGCEGNLLPETARCGLFLPEAAGCECCCAVGF